MMKKLNLMAGILGILAFLMAPPSWAQQQVPPAAPEQQVPRTPRPPRQSRPPRRPPSSTILRPWRPYRGK